MTKKKPTSRSKRITSHSRSTPAKSSPPPPPTGFFLHGVAEPQTADALLQGDLVDRGYKGALAPPSTRADMPTTTVEVGPDDIVEVIFEDGERLWLRADDYLALEGSTPDRGSPGEEGLSVPAELQLLPEGMQARGPVKWIVKSLKIFGIDLQEMAVDAIAERVEKKVGKGEEQKRRPGLGLFQCAMETDEFALSEVKKFTDGAEQPFLLFLHGTASSTWGSFGDLWSHGRADELAQLRTQYGERVLAYEHASLTQSPIENALDLIATLEKMLPAGAMLHVVTHSRGGMIGELL